ncbi:MAG: C4-type zinc ribbon domain-containing protein [Nannocystaceae bacterium]
MNEQIVALRKLQEADRRMLGIERRLKWIPKQLETLDADLARLEAMLLTEHTKLEESRAFKAQQQSQLEDEDEHIRVSKQRLASVKNARELTAAQREIDTTRRMAQSRSEEIEKISSAIAKAESGISGMERELAAVRSQAELEKKKLCGEQTALESALGKTRSSRDKLTAEVDRDSFRMYERVRTRTNGIAFVPVHQQRCMACKMQIAHQAYVTLRKGEEIINCEYCGRLLYWAAHFPEEVERLIKVEKGQKGG